jgi:hypothetical protein
LVEHGSDEVWQGGCGILVKTECGPHRWLWETDVLLENSLSYQAKVSANKRHVPQVGKLTLETFCSWALR